MNHAFLLAFCIGFVAGLRSLVTPAVVSWAAHLGWLPLRGTALSWMASPIAVGVWSVLAVLELIADVAPKTPPRTAPASLAVRVVTGGLCGACLAAAGGGVVWIGIVLGIAGAMIGAYAGLFARRGLVNALKVRDYFIAVPEDIVAIVLAFLIAR
jgi:uncharacterized membrane protein